MRASVMDINQDGVYCILAFICTGIVTILSSHVHQQEHFYKLDEAITVSLIMLLTGLWFLIALLTYKAYDIIRTHFWLKHSSPLHEEEMLILMDAMDTYGARARKSRFSGNSAVSGDEMTAQNMPYAAIVHVLRIRNDILVNVYLVASGVFFSAFALGCLDGHSVAFFSISLLVLSGRDLLSRAARKPTCFDASVCVSVHRRTCALEAAGLVLLLIFSILLASAAAYAPDTYASASKRHILHVASALAPFLIWMSPSGHHYIIAFETSIPVGCLFAVCALYSLSPISPYMETIAIVGGMWPYMLLVPVLFPVLVISLMHSMRNGTSITYACVLCFWSSIFVAIDRRAIQHDGARVALLVIITGTLPLMAYLYYYRRQTISSHMIYDTQSDVVVRGSSSSMTDSEACFRVDGEENDLSPTEDTKETPANRDACRAAGAAMTV